MINKIKISGKEYPCHITMGAMARFHDETGHDISEMRPNDSKDMCVFMFCCVKSACNANKVDFGTDFWDFADNLDPACVKDFYESLAEEQKKANSPVVRK